MRWFIMRKSNYSYYQGAIKECYITQNKHFPEVSEEVLKGSLVLIDEYIDVVLDTFLSHGLQENYEPNKYGIELESIQDYLIEMRCAIVG